MARPDFCADQSDPTFVLLEKGASFNKRQAEKLEIIHTVYAQRRMYSSTGSKITRMDVNG